MRIAKYDNAKAILIYLVVLGHLSIMHTSTDPASRWMTLYIYTFHMPAFIFISGLFHKKPDWRKALSYIIIAYLMKAMLHLTHFITSQSPTFHLVTEPEAPWFLIALAEYELLSYLTIKTNKKILLSCSILLSIVSGFLVFSDIFSTGRMLLFSPFYVLGEMLDKESLASALENRKFKIAGSAFFVVMAIACLPKNLYPMRNAMTGRMNYWILENSTGISLGLQPLVRLAILLIMLWGTFSILTVTPSRKIKRLTDSGGKTLQVYFWHRPLCFFVTTITACGLGYPLIALAITILLNAPVFAEPAKTILTKCKCIGMAKSNNYTC